MAQITTIDGGTTTTDDGDGGKLPTSLPNLLKLGDSGVVDGEVNVPADVIDDSALQTDATNISSEGANQPAN